MIDWNYGTPRSTSMNGLQVHISLLHHALEAISKLVIYVGVISRHVKVGDNTSILYYAYTLNMLKRQVSEFGMNKSPSDG